MKSKKTRNKREQPKVIIPLPTTGETEGGAQLEARLALEFYATAGIHAIRNVAQTKRPAIDAASKDIYFAWSGTYSRVKRCCSASGLQLLMQVIGWMHPYIVRHKLRPREHG